MSGRVVPVEMTALLQPYEVAPQAPLEMRLRVIRKKRLASRLSDATTLAIWIAGLAALSLVIGGGLFVIH